MPRRAACSERSSNRTHQKRSTPDRGCVEPRTVCVPLSQCPSVSSNSHPEQSRPSNSERSLPSLTNTRNHSCPTTIPCTRCGAEKQGTCARIVTNVAAAVLQVTCLAVVMVAVMQFRRPASDTLAPERKEIQFLFLSFVFYSNR